MSTHSCRDMEELPAPPKVKVHARLCFYLRNLVDIVSEIIPEIEAARPGTVGMEALCQLYNLMDKAKSLLQRCSQSSILLLVLAGNTILSRCKMLKRLIKQNLSKVQKTVLFALAEKISGIILELRSVVFCLDSSEEEARRVLRNLLYNYTDGPGSTHGLALSAIHAVCSGLQISSPKALWIERRSIRTVVNKFGDRDRDKRKVLIFLQNLLSKYGKVEQGWECQHNHDIAQMGLLSWPEPPKEFLCPLSMRVMHDPVVIASGLTYDRASIQQWFDEGHDTCPETNQKLDQFSVIANAVMKDVISKWHIVHHIGIMPNANSQGKMVKPWKLMSINSIGSLASGVDNLMNHH